MVDSCGNDMVRCSVMFCVESEAKRLQFVVPRQAVLFVIEPELVGI